MAAAKYWDNQKRPKGLLWRSPDLDLLRTFEQKARSKQAGLTMTELSVKFFEAADQAEEDEQLQKEKEEQRKRLFFRVVVAGLLFTTTLSLFAGYKVHQGARRQMRFYEATAKASADTDQLASLVNGLAAIGMGRSIFVKFPRLRSDGLLTTAVLDRPNRTAKFRYVAGHTLGVESVAFSPDGHTVVSGSSDGTVRLWDLQGNPISKPFQGHTNSVTSVAFSPDGQTVVSGGNDNTVRLWDLQGNAIGAPFQGHTDTVFSVAFSPDGQTVVSGSNDNTVRLWPVGEVNGWLPITCNRLRGYFLSRSKPDDVTREARRTCEKYAWK